MDEVGLSGAFGIMSLPTLLFIPTEGKPAISPGAPPKQMLKELIDEKLLGKKDDIKKQLNKFQSMMNKIKAVLS